VTVLEILPIGCVEDEWLRYLRDRLAEFFGEVVVSPPVEVPLRFNSRGQVLADHLLDTLASRPTAAERVLAVIDRDITVAGVDYIFGLAALGGRWAVISPFRLRDARHGREWERELFLERLLKEALHELGHTLGMVHCENSECNMKFSSTVDEIDRKSLLFCESCLGTVFSSGAEKVYATNGRGSRSFLRALLGRLRLTQKPGAEQRDKGD